MLLGTPPLPDDSFPPPPKFLTLQEEVDWQRARIDSMRRKISAMEFELEYYKRWMYGPRTEKTSSSDQAEEKKLLGVAVKEDDESSAEDGAEADTQETLADKRKKGAQGKKKNGGGRKPVNPNLRVIKKIIAADDSEKTGPNGEPYVLLGYEITDRTHIIPAEVVCLREMREKWGEPDTHIVRVTASLPPRIIPKGKLTDQALCELMYGKYILGVPFYRQCADYNLRDADLNTSLCSDAARRFATFMQPIQAAILAEILRAPYIHIDETVMREFDREKVKKRYIWAWHAGGQTFFHYGGRGAVEVKRVLGMKDDDSFDDFSGYHGFFMADGLNVYDSMHASASAGSTMQRLLCMVHARRQFYNIAHHYGHADEIVRLFNAVQKVDREAKKYCAKKKLHDQDAHDYIYRMRQEQSLPALETLKERLLELQPLYDTQKEFANAFAYTLDRWDELTRYTERGDLPIDNNAAERSIRPITIGRKNYLFVGSEDAGDWCATNYTVLESARCLKIDPRWYMAHVIEAIHAGRNDYENLTPKALKETYRRQKK